MRSLAKRFPAYHHDDKDEAEGKLAMIVFCKLAGTEGHMNCGICPEHMCARRACGCHAKEDR